MNEYYVYILVVNNYSRSYVGKTNNPRRRIAEHNQGKHISTKAYRPWKMIHLEKFNSEEDARKREKYLKSGSGRELKRLVINIYRGVEQSGSSPGS